MPRWWPWSREVDYETALPLLTNQVRQSQIDLSRARARERRVKGLLVLYGLIAYAGLLVVLFFSNATSAVWVSALIGAGSIIWLVRWSAVRVLGYFTNRRQNITAQLIERRRIMAEEYKQKTNYYKVKELTELRDPDNPETGAPVQPPRNHPSTATSGPKLNSSSSPNQQTTTKEKPSLPQPPRAEAGQNPSGEEGQSPEHRAVPGQTSQAEPLPPVRRTWMDRILDVLIGEDETSPQNRYALICKNCGTHNGLAAFGEQPEDVIYRCPVCGKTNKKNFGEIAQPSEGSGHETPSLHSQSADGSEKPKNSSPQDPLK